VECGKKEEHKKRDRESSSQESPATIGGSLTKRGKSTLTIRGLEGNVLCRFDRGSPEKSKKKGAREENEEKLRFYANEACRYLVGGTESIRTGVGAYLTLSGQC